MEKLFYTTLRSLWGELLISSSSLGVTGLHFLDSEDSREALERIRLRSGAAETVESSSAHHGVLEEIAAYDRGELVSFSVPLDLKGTEFQLATWRELCRIPYGETRSYGDIARSVGRPLAFRAVGMANHSNPVALIVPCHRVVQSDGSLGGYGGGLDLKRRLLGHEQRFKPASRSLAMASSL